MIGEKIDVVCEKEQRSLHSKFMLSIMTVKYVNEKLTEIICGSLHVVRR